MQITTLNVIVSMLFLQDNRFKNFNKLVLCSYDLNLNKIKSENIESKGKLKSGHYFNERRCFGADLTLVLIDDFKEPFFIANGKRHSFSKGRVYAKFQQKTLFSIFKIMIESDVVVDFQYFRPLHRKFLEDPVLGEEHSQPLLYATTLINELGSRCHSNVT